MPRSLLLIILSFIFAPVAHGDDAPFPDGGPASLRGGLMIIRRGDQTTLSVGGVLLDRRVKVTTATPEGPIVSRFVLPSPLHSPHRVPLPEAAPASLQVEIPDTFGLLYVEGAMIRGQGTKRYLQSPPIPPGQQLAIHLRAAFQRGKQLLIEDHVVAIAAGTHTSVIFDGRHARAVSLQP